MWLEILSETGFPQFVKSIQANEYKVLLHLFNIIYSCHFDKLSIP